VEEGGLAPSPPKLNWSRKIDTRTVLLYQVSSETAAVKYHVHGVARGVRVLSRSADATVFNSLRTCREVRVEAVTPEHLRCVRGGWPLHQGPTQPDSPRLTPFLCRVRGFCEAVNVASVAYQ
jgi:hypothetical protein